MNFNVFYNLVIEHKGNIMAKLDYLSLNDLSVNCNYTDEQKQFVEHFKKLNKDFIPSCFEDSDFLTKFMVATPKEDWAKFVINTKKHLIGDKTFDPQFVLMFRRTTLKDEAKPEVFWTNEYGVVKDGLKKEIPPHSEHRILSKIFVSTLDKLNSHKQSLEECQNIDKKYGVGSSDGEIRISSIPFPLKENCLFAIKPTSEQKELDEYLKANEKTD